MGKPIHVKTPSKDELNKLFGVRNPRYAARKRTPLAPPALPSFSRVTTPVTTRSPAPTAPLPMPPRRVPWPVEDEYDEVLGPLGPRPVPPRRPAHLPPPVPPRPMRRIAPPPLPPRPMLPPPVPARPTSRNLLARPPLPPRPPMRSIPPVRRVRVHTALFPPGAPLVKPVTPVKKKSSLLSRLFRRKAADTRKKRKPSSYIQVVYRGDAPKKCIVRHGYKYKLEGTGMDLMTGQRDAFYTRGRKVRSL